VNLGVEVVGIPQNFEFSRQKVLCFQGLNFAKESFSTASLDGEGATTTSAEEMSGATMRSALLKTGLQFHTEHVLTPRGKDLDPGSWTRGHRSSAVYHPSLTRQLRINREVVIQNDR
jgi:hypothetical protein